MLLWTGAVEYFRHLISRESIATDQTKVEAMKKWLAPANIKELREILGSLDFIGGS